MAGKKRETTRHLRFRKVEETVVKEGINSVTKRYRPSKFPLHCESRSVVMFCFYVIVVEGISGLGAVRHRSYGSW